ncbi:MAG: zinc ribbon domain-containing protein [Candidatus Bathyarchaeia archaeon]|nr:zinc ribbon domain-containing protein [Candidatus Bathyarchaeota archaeon]
MIKCQKCGWEISWGRNVKFCPNCGAPIPAPTISSGIRVAAFIILLILCISVTAIGASIKIEVSEARSLSHEVESLENAVRSIGFQAIFGNNFMHALIMFAPIVGPIWGFSVLYNTGKVIAAISIVNELDPRLNMLVLFFFPFTWMEYISYALAISESIFLTYSIIKRNFREEFTTASKLVVLCSIILLIAALIEFYVISLLESSLKI